MRSRRDSKQQRVTTKELGEFDSVAFIVTTEAEFSKCKFALKAQTSPPDKYKHKFVRGRIVTGLVISLPARHAFKSG
jgi:hypothetical protein